MRIREFNVISECYRELSDMKRMQSKTKARTISANAISKPSTPLFWLRKSADGTKGSRRNVRSFMLKEYCLNGRITYVFLQVGRRNTLSHIWLKRKTSIHPIFMVCRCWPITSSEPLRNPQVTYPSFWLIDCFVHILLYSFQALRCEIQNRKGTYRPSEIATVKTKKK